MHQIFQARSLRLDKQLSAEGAASWTSGLLIGADVGGALTMFDEDKQRAGAGHRRTTAHRELFAVALARRGRKAVQIDGAQAALAGLAHIFQERQRA